MVTQKHPHTPLFEGMQLYLSLACMTAPQIRFGLTLVEIDVHEAGMCGGLRVKGFRAEPSRDPEASACYTCIPGVPAARMTFPSLLECLASRA